MANAEIVYQLNEKYRLICKEASSFLHEMTPNGVQLEKYFVTQNCDSLQDVYVRLIYSAQNTQMMPKVIKFHQNQEVIKNVLQNFDYQKIKDIAPETLFETFQKHITINNAESKQNLWLKWCKSAVDSAKFVSEFNDFQAFNDFVCSFNADPKKLPIQIADKIHGIGFALACDALKELGYTQYCKPDVHIKELLSALHICQTDDYEVFDTVVEMARAYDDMSPQQIDRMLWLICSGNFFLDNQRVSGKKQEFIDHLKDTEQFRQPKKIVFEYGDEYEMQVIGCHSIKELSCLRDALIEDRIDLYYSEPSEEIDEERMEAYGLDEITAKSLVGTLTCRFDSVCIKDNNDETVVDSVDIGTVFDLGPCGELKNSDYPFYFLAIAASDVYSLEAKLPENTTYRDIAYGDFIGTYQCIILENTYEENLAEEGVFVGGGQSILCFIPDHKKEVLLSELLKVMTLDSDEDLKDFQEYFYNNLHECLQEYCAGDDIDFQSLVKILDEVGFHLEMEASGDGYGVYAQISNNIYFFNAIDVSYDMVEDVIDEWGLEQDDFVQPVIEFKDDENKDCENYNQPTVDRKLNMTKSSAIFENYEIIREENNSITICIKGGKTKEILREISIAAKFNYDESWNTQQFGAKLIEYLNKEKENN